MLEKIFHWLIKCAQWFGFVYLTILIFLILYLVIGYINKKLKSRNNKNKRLDNESK